MSKYAIEESTLTAIGNAIRAKNGETNLYTPEEMVTAIAAITVKDGDGLPAEAFNYTGDCTYAFANNHYKWVIDNYSELINTEDITNCAHMFENCSSLTSLGFDINCKENEPTRFTSMFKGCSSLVEVPVITHGYADGLEDMFNGCSNLRNLPLDINDYFDWGYFDNDTIGGGDFELLSMRSIFKDCHSLRNIPSDFLNHSPDVLQGPVCARAYSYEGFRNCYALDSLENLPVYKNYRTWTEDKDLFYACFNNCSKLSKLTFASNYGLASEANWDGQVIDLTTYVGYGLSANWFTGYNSGLTTATQIVDDATYAALKNNPDAWTLQAKYSRYNHDSAVSTLKTLPDTSEYGGNNIIRFLRNSGSATDGGAISNLTDTEIAVATAKGWTVVLTY